MSPDRCALNTPVPLPTTSSYGIIPFARASKEASAVRRFIILATMTLLMAAMLLASTGVAQALLGSGTVGIVRTDSGVAVDPTVCELAAGTAGLEWRPGGVCWLELPGWDAAF